MLVDTLCSSSQNIADFDGARHEIAGVGKLLDSINSDLEVLKDERQKNGGSATV